MDRRKFLVGGMYTVVFAAVTGVAGQYFVRRSAASASRSAVRIPSPSSPLPAPPAGTDVGVPGVSPFITPNDAFYRVDTALLMPAVSADDWQLHIHGMVDKEVTLDYASSWPGRSWSATSRSRACRTRWAGATSGTLAGSARRSADLLRRPGVNPGADQLVVPLGGRIHGRARPPRP